MFKVISKYFSTPSVADLSAQALDAAKRDLLNCLNVLDSYEGRVMGLRKTIARLEAKDAKVEKSYSSDTTSNLITK
jgi:hypothetical protein